ncbi:MAG TPA: CCA tRNA nucleotidyltransferase [Stellaceae bacterium]
MSRADFRPNCEAGPPWLAEPGTRAVLAALAARGAQARFVGGCVRDALLGRDAGDVDIATDAPPETVMAALEAAGIRAVPTGLAHGTVTAIVPPRSFEITTLRHDVETFGRHARVAFTQDWAADAQRRDFTMNALFLDAEGRVYDFVGGLDDLRAGRVRFVGDPATRIREDVLRILRFYRFHARYGRGEADPDARAACRALAPLLPGLSAERVQAELLKLLAAPDPAPTSALMLEDGVLSVLLPAARRADRLAALTAIEPPPPDPLRRLAALLDISSAAEAEAVGERLRLSNRETKRLAAVAEPPWPVDLAADERTQRRAIYRLGTDLYRDLVLLRAAAAAADGDHSAPGRAGGLLAVADAWPPPRFPIGGREALSLGLVPGPRLGELLRAVEQWWEEGDFQADRQACMDRLAAMAGSGAAS